LQAGFKEEMIYMIFRSLILSVLFLSFLYLPFGIEARIAKAPIDEQIRSLEIKTPNTWEPLSQPWDNRLTKESSELFEILERSFRLDPPFLRRKGLATFVKAVQRSCQQNFQHLFWSLSKKLSPYQLQRRIDNPSLHRLLFSHSPTECF
jgi:hypothetical protein